MITDPCSSPKMLLCEVLGADAVAELFSGRAWVAKVALLGGTLGAVFAPRGAPRVAFNFTVYNGRITRVDLLADPEHLRRLDAASSTIDRCL